MYIYNSYVANSFSIILSCCRGAVYFCHCSVMNNVFLSWNLDFLLVLRSRIILIGSSFQEAKIMRLRLWWRPLLSKFQKINAYFELGSGSCPNKWYGSAPQQCFSLLFESQRQQKYHHSMVFKISIVFICTLILSYKSQIYFLFLKSNKRIALVWLQKKKIHLILRNEITHVRFRVHLYLFFQNPFLLFFSISKFYQRNIDWLKRLFKNRDCQGDINLKIYSSYKLLYKDTVSWVKYCPFQCYFYLWKEKIH
jgi:hypothetical protein